MKLSKFNLVENWSHSNFFRSHYRLCIWFSINFIWFFSGLFFGFFSGTSIIFDIIVFFFFKFFTHWGLHSPGTNIRTWFGVPGAGKTTMAAYLARESWQSGKRPVLSNVHLAGAYRLDPVRDLGTYSTFFRGYGSHVIIDEATIDYDGRDYKSFSKNNKSFFALARHDKTQVDVFSQAVDFDKRIRDRSASLFYIRRSLLPHCVVYRRILKILTINKDSHEMIDGFKFAPFSTKIIWSRPLWKCFNTLDRDLCPKAVRVWLPWDQDGDQISVEDQIIQ